MSVLVAFALTLNLATLPTVAVGISNLLNPLPSWHSGSAKSAIIDFVDQITDEASSDYIPVEDRIAVFDNDGTLWSERPLIQGAFIMSQLQQKAAKDPTIMQSSLIQALAQGDVAYLYKATAADITNLLAVLNTGVSEVEFNQEVEAFFKTATHPQLNVPYTELTFKPMVELLEYLRVNGFQTWICSGGGVNFMRVVSEQLYGIPPQQVIGSSVQKEFVPEEGKFVLTRTDKLGSFNDKSVKPVNIDLHIGKYPVFAAGNVKSGGDIAMLTYSQERSGPSFQMIVNHDDAEREFAYTEPDNASLNAATANGWQIVSIKQDWKTVFSYQEHEKD
ncbi:MAG: HAD family hydrolase [Microcoleaceae cyanobacterium]